MNVGIYTITNLVTSGFYIGSSVEVPRRWLNHLSDLRRNKHINPYLQHAFNKYGESNFHFELIIECEPEEVLNWEQTALDAAVLNGDRIYNLQREVTKPPLKPRGIKQDKPAWNKGTGKAPPKCRYCPSPARAYYHNGSVTGYAVSCDNPSCRYKCLGDRRRKGAKT